MSAEGIYLGLMSGTSIDSVDAIAVKLSPEHGLQILDAHSCTIPDSLRTSILKLCTPGDDHVQLLGETDHQIGKLFAQTANELLANLQIPAAQVAAIGSHGQTIRHAPPGQSDSPFTLQIGDPNLIATLTSCVVVADLRRKDVALGGQGAPLVPAFHRDLFQHHSRNRVIVNIGGIANITWLPSAGSCTGFDTGPGNMLLDAWCQAHRNQPWDENGNWAASGRVNSDLLKKLKSHAYFAESPPKSTGRELFNADWLYENLTGEKLAVEDVQATLLQLTAETIGDAIQSLTPSPDEVYVCGGGALNGNLMRQLARLLNPVSLDSTSALGLDPKLVEAAAFAWLARRRMLNLPGNLPAVTGAMRETVLGAVYLP